MQPMGDVPLNPEGIADLIAEMIGDDDNERKERIRRKILTSASEYYKMNPRPYRSQRIEGKDKNTRKGDKSGEEK